jgi:hypothetical protein
MTVQVENAPSVSHQYSECQITGGSLTIGANYAATTKMDVNGGTVQLNGT